MLLADLYRECKKVNTIDAFYLTPEQRNCKYSNVEIICLKMVRKIIIPIGWGYDVRETITYAIDSIRAQCQKESNVTNPNQE